jgi:hypothetical protein
MNGFLKKDPSVRSIARPVEIAVLNGFGNMVGADLG